MLRKKKKKKKSIVFEMDVKSSSWLPAIKKDVKVLLQLYKSVGGWGTKYVLDMLEEYKASESQRYSQAVSVRQYRINTVMLFIIFTLHFLN